MLPARDDLTICFAHAAYRMQDRFALRDTGIRSIEVRDRAALDASVGAADVLVVSGLWNDALIPRAPRLRFIQSISAGVDQYGKDALRGAGIRLASAQGANARAVAEHAMALILALSRLLPEARDNQAKRVWRGMIGDLARREDELGGKTLLIVGLGRIGGRLAQLAKAFDMRVVGIRREPQGRPQRRRRGARAGPAEGAAPAGGFRRPDLPADARDRRADRRRGAGPDAAFGASHQRRARPRLRGGRGGRSAGRGPHRRRGAGLHGGRAAAADSPLWAMPNVLITPHTAGETRRYEDNVIDLLLENLDRLWRGESALKNQVL